MNNFFFIFNLMLLVSVFSFVLISMHFLNLLLAVEFMMLTLFMMISILTQWHSKEIVIIFLFLCMMIMEGVFSLALLLMTSQSYGKDYFSHF